MGGGSVTRKQAIKLAIAALEAERKRHAVSANMYTQLGLDVPSTRNAAERYAEINEAIKVLQGPSQASFLEAA